MIQGKRTRILADKYKAGGEFYDNLRKNSTETIVTTTEKIIERDSDYSQNKASNKIRCKFGFIAKCTCIVLIFVLALSAYKNPTRAEAEAELKMLVLNKFKDTMMSNMEDDRSTNSVIGSGLAMLFAPTIIDNIVRVNVTDYIIFSSFRIDAEIDGESGKLASGIIFCGNIIPLSTDSKIMQ